MEVGYVPRQLWRLRLWVLFGVVVAGLGAVASAYRITPGLPPSFEEKSLRVGTASTELLVDVPESLLASLDMELFPLSSRALVYARLISSEAIKKEVSRKIGVPATAIAATGPPPPGSERGREVSAEVRAQELVNEPDEYRMLAFRAKKSPMVSVFTQGPTREEAVKLANVAAAALSRHVDVLERRQKVRKGLRLRVTPLGAAHGGVVNEGSNKILAGLVFIGLFLVWCLGVLAVSGLVAGHRRAHSTRDEIGRVLRPSTARKF